MTELQCNVTSCASNAANHCCRPEIHVAGQNAHHCDATCCASFQDKQQAATNVVRYDVPDQKLDIRCEAHNCKYNEHGKCDADCVQVGGNGACCCEQTECDTFCCR